MKRFVSIIMAAALLMCMGVSAYAAANGHVNDFYWQHKDEVTPDGNKYTVNSPDGYVTAWSAPTEKRAYGNIPNGTVLEVTAAYLGWSAVTYINADGAEQCYWIPSEMMSELTTGESFIRDNSDRFMYDKSDLKAMKYYTTENTIYLYTYPNSGVVSSELTNIGRFDTGPVFSAIYADVDGIKWGYLEYYGDWNYKAWVCINDPENGELEAKEPINMHAVVTPCADEPKIHYANAIKETDPKLVKTVAIAASAASAMIIIAAILYGRKLKRTDTAEEESSDENETEEEKAPKLRKRKLRQPKERKVKEPKPKKEKEPKPEKVREPKPKKEKKPRREKMAEKPENKKPAALEDEELAEEWEKTVAERKVRTKNNKPSKKGRHEM